MKGINAFRGRAPVFVFIIMFFVVSGAFAQLQQPDIYRMWFYNSNWDIQNANFNFQLGIQYNDGVPPVNKVTGEILLSGPSEQQLAAYYTSTPVTLLFDDRLYNITVSVPDPSMQAGVWQIEEIQINFITVTCSYLKGFLEDKEFPTQITILNSQPPVADGGPDQYGFVGETFTFDGSNSYSQNGSILSYVWIFGDESPTTSGVTVIHSYSTEGTYQVTLTVKDNYYLQSSDQLFVCVFPSPAAAVEELIARLESMGVAHGIKNSLLSKLENTLFSLGKDNNKAAINKLKAFINQVLALIGNKVPEADAEFLLMLAEKTKKNLENALAKRFLAYEGGHSPDDFVIFQNYPNPFNPCTEIPYYMPRACHVRLDVYNELGQRIRTLVSGVKEKGIHHVLWDGRDDYNNQVSAGVYIISIKSEEFTAVRKTLYIR